MRSRPCIASTLSATAGRPRAGTKHRRSIQRSMSSCSTTPSVRRSFLTVIDGETQYEKQLSARLPADVPHASVHRLQLRRQQRRAHRRAHRRGRERARRPADRRLRPERQAPGRRLAADRLLDLRRGSQRATTAMPTVGWPAGDRPRRSARRGQDEALAEPDVERRRDRRRHAPSSFGADGNDFLGDDLPTGRLRGALQWTAPNNKLSFGANLGVILRKPRTIYASTIGQQLTFGAGGVVRATDRLDVIGEIFGRGGLPELRARQSPIEAMGGCASGPAKSLSVLVGGGAGLTEGVGSPQLRVFASVGYAPDVRDSDGDGIANQNDKCPLTRRGQGRLRGRRRLSRRRQRRRSPPRRRGQVPQRGRGPRRLRGRRRLPRARQRQGRHRGPRRQVPERHRGRQEAVRQGRLPGRQARHRRRRQHGQRRSVRRGPGGRRRLRGRRRLPRDRQRQGRRPRRRRQVQAVPGGQGRLRGRRRLPRARQRQGRRRRRLRQVPQQGRDDQRRDRRRRLPRHRRQGGRPARRQRHPAERRRSTSTSATASSRPAPSIRWRRS